MSVVLALLAHHALEFIISPGVAQDGKTALLKCVVLSGKKGTVKCLVEGGADLNAQDLVSCKLKLC